MFNRELVFVEPNYASNRIWLIVGLEPSTVLAMQHRSNSSKDKDTVI